MGVGDRLAWLAVGDVDRNAGVALAKTRGAFHGVGPVRDVPFTSTPALPAGGIQHVIGPAEGAGRVGADAHNRAPDRLAIEQANKNR